MLLLLLVFFFFVNYILQEFGGFERPEQAPVSTDFRRGTTNSPFFEYTLELSASIDEDVLL